MCADATNWRKHPPDVHVAYYAGYEDSRLETRDALGVLRDHGLTADMNALLATYREAYAEQTFGWDAITHVRTGAGGHGTTLDQTAME